jgi:hypothetical protein
LETRRQFSNFIQEQGASIRLLEAPDTAKHRVRKGALLRADLSQLGVAQREARHEVRVKGSEAAGDLRDAAIQPDASRKYAGGPEQSHAYEGCEQNALRPLCGSACPGSRFIAQVAMGPSELEAKTAEMTTRSCLPRSTCSSSLITLSAFPPKPLEVDSRIGWPRCNHDSAQHGAALQLIEITGSSSGISGSDLAIAAILELIQVNEFD